MYCMNFEYVIKCQNVLNMGNKSFYLIQRIYSLCVFWFRLRAFLSQKTILTDWSERLVHGVLEYGLKYEIWKWLEKYSLFSHSVVTKTNLYFYFNAKTQTWDFTLTLTFSWPILNAKNSLTDFIASCISYESFVSLTIFSGYVDVEVKAVLTLVLNISRCSIQVVCEPHR